MGWPGRASALQDVKSCGGIEKHKEHVPCHTNPHQAERDAINSGSAIALFDGLPRAKP
jgi:hypothetical protein